MAVRNTMLPLISRVRVMINDPSGASQIFTDQDIQNVMDESRLDLYNEPLEYAPTYVSGSIQWLSYWHKLTNFEDGMVLKQYLTTTVTPSVIDPINGFFTFAASTFPPVYLTGSVHDIYRASADLLERWAAKWVLQFSFSSDGQSFQRAQASHALQTLAKTYRMKQRAGSINITRSDLGLGGNTATVGLGPTEIDYMA